MFAREVGFRMGGSCARRRFSAWTDKYTNVPLSDVLCGGDSGIQPHTLILMNDAENPGVVASVVRNCHLLGASAVLLGTTNGYNYTQSFIKSCLRHSMAYCFGGPHLIVGVESAYATRLLSTSYGYTIGSLVRDGPTCSTAIPTVDLSSDVTDTGWMGCSHLLMTVNVSQCTASDPPEEYADFHMEIPVELELNYCLTAAMLQRYRLTRDWQRPPVCPPTAMRYPNLKKVEENFYGSYGNLLLTREALRIARCTRAADYLDELLRKACEHIRLPSSGDERVLNLLRGSSSGLVKELCQAAADEHVGQDWLDAAKESVECVRESGVAAHVIIVLRDERNPLRTAEQLWLFSIIAATRLNPMMKPFHLDLAEARERLALQASDETEILDEVSTVIGVPPMGIDIRKGSLRIGMGVIGHLLKHEAALVAPKSRQDRCERILKTCMSRKYAAKTVRTVVQIQSLYRSWFERKESLERVPRALNCLFGALCLLRRVNEFSKRHAAVVHLQRTWRKKRTRMKYAKAIMQLRRIRASIVIQAFYRRLVATRIVEELRLKQTRVYSIEIIQCFIRRYLARRTLLDRAFRLRAEKSAVLIQAHWRGLLIRRWWGRVRGGLPWLALIVKSKLIAMKEAQVKLAAWWRGVATRVVRSGPGQRVYEFMCAAREGIREEVRQHRSARRIQTRWRSYRLVRQLKTLTKTSYNIQAAIRTISWRRWWVSLRRTVIHLQRNFRARAELAEMERQLRANEWSVRSITHQMIPIALSRDICVIHAPENAEESLRSAFDTNERNHGYDLHIFGSRCKHVIALKQGWLWVSGHVVPPPPRLEAVTVKTIACGSQHILFTCHETELCFAWGSNSMGQCGLPQDAVAFLRTPLIIPLKGSDGRVKFIAASGKTSAYVTTRRPSRVHVIGQCIESECATVGDFGEDAIIKVVLSVFEDASQRVLRPCVFVLTATGELYSWGDNTCKQLGRSTECLQHSRVPGKVDLDAESAGRIVQVSVAAGAVYVLAVTDAGEVFAWGTVMRAHAGGPPEAFNFDRPTSVILPLENTVAIQVAASWSDRWFVVLAPQYSVWCCRGLRRRGAFAVVENADPIKWPAASYESRAGRALLRCSNSVKGSLVYVVFE
ncbi:regulator of chromosome condensation, putative [Perkinsus marinus ATCC 50983]|uniref:Regulator of chromosome condensation, putative n=1 Tax=Perkinsus marinus (strain ATCC 50983 / TXsc) TaxID=423536 RepID=C5KPM5_PERM5|nr:regulator of chromosome condensation, putative [Perkinsus marinus ATCC 50983]EER13569.1 regulator of chromosome condensation, putative [Perkinsus marinus ATCC 50983]|eukprot:XP_002781774.1 regulator of chromosome condensation, putative [Perkinsus marinus ATCC 50983]